MTRNVEYKWRTFVVKMEKMTGVPFAVATNFNISLNNKHALKKKKMFARARY